MVDNIVNKMADSGHSIDYIICYMKEVLRITNDLEIQKYIQPIIDLRLQEVRYYLRVHVETMFDRFKYNQHDVNLSYLSHGHCRAIFKVVFRDNRINSEMIRGLRESLEAGKNRDISGFLYGLRINIEDIFKIDYRF